MADDLEALRDYAKGLMPPSEASVKAYQPTFRDTVANFLLGIGLPPESVRGIVGSAGIGYTGGAPLGDVPTPALADIFPPTAAAFFGQEASKSAERGDLPGAAISTLNAIPLVGPGAKAVGEAAYGVGKAYGVWSVMKGGQPIGSLLSTEAAAKQALKGFQDFKDYKNVVIDTKSGEVKFGKPEGATEMNVVNPVWEDSQSASAAKLQELAALTKPQEPKYKVTPQFEPFAAASAAATDFMNEMQTKYTDQLLQGHAIDDLMSADELAHYDELTNQMLLTAKPKPKQTAWQDFVDADAELSDFHESLVAKYGDNEDTWPPEELDQLEALRENAKSLSDKADAEGVDPITTGGPEAILAQANAQVAKLKSKYGASWMTNAPDEELNKYWKLSHDYQDALNAKFTERTIEPQPEPAKIAAKIIEDKGSQRVPGMAKDITEDDIGYSLGKGSITEEQANAFRYWRDSQVSSEPMGPEAVAKLHALPVEQYNHRDWLMHHEDPTLLDFQPHEVEPIEYYVSGSSGINTPLIKGQPVDDKTYQMILGLDEVIDRGRAPRNIFITSGTNSEWANNIRLLPAGSIVSTPAFLSSTGTKEVAPRFGQSRLQIVIPEGTKSLAFGKLSMSDENEVILPRNAPMRVLDPKTLTLQALDKGEGDVPSADWSKVWHREGGGWSSFVEPPKTANWTIPDRAAIANEYDREVVAHLEPLFGKGTLFKNKEDFIDRVNNANLEWISREEDAKIDYRSHTKDMGDLLGLISTYRSFPEFRNEATLKSLAARISSGKEVDAPIVLRFPNGRMRVLGGNTRMDIGFMHNDYVKALVVDVGEEGGP